MKEVQQAEALRLALVIKTPKRPPTDLRNRVATELCRQNARIIELEAELDAIGAGGVEPLRKCNKLHQIAEPATAQAAPSEVMGALRALHDSVELAIHRGALSERALEIIIMQPATDVLMRAAAPQAVQWLPEIKDMTNSPQLLNMHDRVRKKSGSEWQGRIVGWYSTELTPEGYAVESEIHKGSVQIYPAKALQLVVEAKQGEQANG